MSRNDDNVGPDVEFLEAGPDPAPVAAGAPVRRWPRWSPILLAGLAAATVIALIVHENSKPTATRQLGTSAPDIAPASSSSLLAPAVVTEAGHRLLGVTAGWELFGRGDGVVVRIQLAQGRITRTTVPGLASTGAVSFVIGAQEAIVRPIDEVPGYVVPDGQPAQQISESLSLGQGGPAFPGPDTNHIWVQDQAGPSALLLSRFDGAGAGVRIAIPPGGSSLDAVPDGAGYLLFPATGGVYDARPDGFHRITTGALLAVGPTGWLTLDCDAHARCTTVLVNRATNARRAVGPPTTAGAQIGVIAPDGKTAALFRADPTSNALRLYLLNLTNGATRDVAVSIEQGGGAGTVVWSPDSRWLFTLDADGTLDAVDPRTGQATDITGTGGSLPPLSQLAIRPAEASGNG